MRLVFMGTPEFAIPSLERLIADGHRIVGVVTGPDRPSGRGQRFTPSPVKELAQSHGLSILTPEDLKDRDFLEALREMRPDLIVVVAFRILPPEVLAIPSKGTVNLHASLLPKYRGAAPINWAIINGEAETGVTTFFIDRGVDTGDIILQKTVGIGEEETAGELHDRLKVIGADLLSRTVSCIARGDFPRRPQSLEGAIKAPKLKKDDGRIDWQKSAQQIKYLIRGTNPYPGAFTHRKGSVLKIHRAVVISVESSGRPGEVIRADRKDGITVATGRGLLYLSEVQPEGRRPMSSAEYVRGYDVREGEVWGK